MFFRLSGEIRGRYREAVSDVLRFDGLNAAMEVVGVTTIDVGAGGDVVDEKVKQQRRENRALRHPHLNLPPLTSLSLIFNTDTPISEIRREPTLQVRMQVCSVDFLEEAMVVHDVECFAQVYTEETRARGRFLLIETSRGLGDKWE